MHPFVGLAAGLLFGAMPVTAAYGQAGAPAAPEPVEILAIDFDSGRLQGPGAVRLRDELRGAYFVALGEDHGFAGSPQLAAAIATEMEAVPGASPLFHAVEVGPFTTRWSAALLADGGVAALDRALEGRPFAMPFLSNAEDAALAEPFAATNRLWGIDQEFIASPAILFDALIARSTDPSLRLRLAGMRDADRAALIEGRFADVALSTMSEAAFAELAAHFSDDREATAIVTALAASAHIYRLNNSGRYLENNEARSRLMQGYFLTAWHAATPTMPRVLFKMGAYHMGRGTTPTMIYDIGSLLPGLAAARGGHSLHIAYVPVGGSVRVIRPGAAAFTAVTAYADTMVGPIMLAAGIDPAALPPSGHVLIPLAPLRHRLGGARLRELPADARFLVTGFDYLVTTRDAAAAAHLEAN